MYIIFIGSIDNIIVHTYIHERCAGAIVHGMYTLSEKEQIRPFNTPISLHAPVVYFALTRPTTAAVDILYVRPATKSKPETAVHYTLRRIRGSEIKQHTIHKTPSDLVSSSSFPPFK